MSVASTLIALAYFNKYILQGCSISLQVPLLTSLFHFIDKKEELSSYYANVSENVTHSKKVRQR